MEFAGIRAEWIYTHLHRSSNLNCFKAATSLITTYLLAQDVITLYLGPFQCGTVPKNPFSPLKSWLRLNEYVMSLPEMRLRYSRELEVALIVIHSFATHRSKLIHNWQNIFHKMHAIKIVCVCNAYINVIICNAMIRPIVGRRHCVNCTNEPWFYR